MTGFLRMKSKQFDLNVFILDINLKEAGNLFQIEGPE